MCGVIGDLFLMQDSAVCFLVCFHLCWVLEKLHFLPQGRFDRTDGSLEDPTCNLCDVSCDLSEQFLSNRQAALLLALLLHEWRIKADCSDNTAGTFISCTQKSFLNIRVVPATSVSHCTL